MSLDIFSLPRPEYTRQPESLITDLLWGSFDIAVARPGGGHPRLLPVLDRSNANYTGPEGSLPLALQNVGAAAVFAQDGPDEREVLAALLSSLYAPRARASKTGWAFIMVNPDLAAFQNLRGFTNKPQPPNYNKIFEQFAHLGGAAEVGAATHAYLCAFEDRALAKEGAAGVLEAGLTNFATAAFSSFQLGPPWPGTLPSPRLGLAAEPAPISKWLQESPFGWFWSKWRALHKGAVWRNELPARRFADWQSCVARSGLAMGYLYEAQVMLMMKEAIGAVAAGAPAPVAGQRLLRHLGPAPSPLPLGRVFAPSARVSTKVCWPWVQGVIRQGVAFRDAASRLDTASFDAAVAAGQSPGEAFCGWLEALDVAAAQSLVEDATPTATTGNNLLEFIRHLLRPLEDRMDETGFGERADLYGLLRSSTAGTWFEPGPEWLVPVASLLAPEPGGETTLSHVRRDLARLGLECERDVLVSLLEACGLTTDSPDADDGLIVRSGF